MQQTKDTFEIRPARRTDAAHIARLTDMAGEGLASYFWAQLAGPGEDVWAVGEARAARDDGAAVWTNATLAEVGGQAAAVLVTYPIGDTPESLDGVPAIFRPLQELENQALSTLYVNVLATYPQFRGRGIASRLIELAVGQARGRGLSLIVANRNHTAIRLYKAHGFTERARLPVVTGDWHCDSDEWLLLIRPGA